MEETHKHASYIAYILLIDHILEVYMALIHYSIYIIISLLYARRTTYIILALYQGWYIQT